MLVGVVCVSTSLPVIRLLAVHCKFNVQERTALAQLKKKKFCLFANSTTDGTADRKGVFSVLVMHLREEKNGDTPCRKRSTWTGNLKNKTKTKNRLFMFAYGQSKADVCFKNVIMTR